MCLKSATRLQQGDFTDRGFRSYKTLKCVNIMGIFCSNLLLIILISSTYLISRAMMLQWVGADAHELMLR